MLCCVCISCTYIYLKLYINVLCRYFCGMCTLNFKTCFLHMDITINNFIIHLHCYFSSFLYDLIIGRYTTMALHTVCLCPYQCGFGCLLQGKGKKIIFAAECSSCYTPFHHKTDRGRRCEQTLSIQHRVHIT